jgi:hypothetical protein
VIEDKEHDALVERNQWLTNLDEVIAFIKRASANPVYDEDGNEIPGNLYWSWIRNGECKYISLRFDMRDGAFVLLNRNGERISFKQLQWQYSDVAKAGGTG